MQQGTAGHERPVRACRLEVRCNGLWVLRPLTHPVAHCPFLPAVALRPSLPHTQLLKVGERRGIEVQVARELGIATEAVERLPRTYKAACWEGGVPAMLAAGYRLPPRSSQSDDDAAAASSSSGTGSYGPYPRRQYLFVAATMPNVTKADAGAELQQRYRQAVWVTGDLLHRSKPSVQHRWVDVDNASWERALVDAVLKDPDYLAGRARILIFARDTNSANEVLGSASGVLAA